MDRKLPPRHPLFRYRYPITGGIVFIILFGYMISLSSAPRRLKVKSDDIMIAEVMNERFLEYVEVEGIIQPVNTIKVNSRQSGNADSIYVGEGMMVRKGDTIFTIDNPEVLRSIEDQKAEWNKSMLRYREREIEMEQKTLNLRQQALQNDYELKRLRKSYDLDLEEYKMGIKSKTQLEIAEDEYHYNSEKARLQRENIRHDSVMTGIRKELLSKEQLQEKLKYERSLATFTDLVVRAPVDGQLSYLNVTPGQRVGSGEAIAEIKIMDKFKIKSSVNEFYVDRFAVALPGNITYQNRNFPLKVCKVIPEVKNRNFDIELLFTDSMPDNARVGKSFRVQIELGQPEQSLIISRGNFYQSTGGMWIYKLDEEGRRAVKTPIVVGRQNPQQYEIISGLKPGEKVIISGYDKFGDIEELVID